MTNKMNKPNDNGFVARITTFSHADIVVSPTLGNTNRTLNIFLAEANSTEIGKTGQFFRAISRIAPRPAKSVPLTVGSKSVAVSPPLTTPAIRTQPVLLLHIMA
jgi:hypothetical protein